MKLPFRRDAKDLLPITVKIVTIDLGVEDKSAATNKYLRLGWEFTLPVQIPKFRQRARDQIRIVIVRNAVMKFLQILIRF